jgi:hypothetical protein
MRSPSRLLTAIVGGLVATLVALATAASGVAHHSSQEVNPLTDEWNPLGMITGFHAVADRKLGLELRVLEADGSASVAEDPVSLFVVARKGATSDVVQHIWRLPRGVERVKRVTRSKCGLDIQAEVDDDSEPFPRRRLALIKTCFVRPNGELEPLLRIDDPR